MNNEQPARSAPEAKPKGNPPDTLESPPQAPASPSPDLLEAARVTAPDRIWLNHGADDHSEMTPQEWRDGEVTWCWHNVHGNDIEYIRADLASTPRPPEAVKAPAGLLELAERMDTDGQTYWARKLREALAAQPEAVKADTASLTETATRNVLETYCESLGLRKGMALWDLAYIVTDRLSHPAPTPSTGSEGADTGALDLVRAAREYVAANRAVVARSETMTAGKWEHICAKFFAAVDALPPESSPTKGGN